MTEGNEICSINYLIGTLATAYKGLITSLIAKDFCMVEREGSIVLSGTILSMPEGNYHAALIHQGIELTRSSLKEGFFEFDVNSELLKNIKNLQIDIVRDGRHIGTLLLKKESTDEFFTSALELSDDLKGVNLRLLTSLLKEKPGLLANADGIISKILSTKKDWSQLSEEINSFSKDLFWFDRDAYYKWYSVLTRWSLKACRMIEGTDKPISNLLFLIELPLENDADMERLHFFAEAWLEIIGRSAIHLSSHLKRASWIFSNIHEKFPDIDIKPVLNQFLGALRDRIIKAPALSDSMIDSMRGSVAVDDLRQLINFSDKAKQNLLFAVDAANALLGKGEYGQILDKIGGVDLYILDETGMVDLFFDVIERNMTGGAAERLSDALCRIFQIFDRLSSGAYRRAMLNLARIMKKLVSLNMVDICEGILTEIKKVDSPFKENVVLNLEIALSIVNTGNNKLIEDYKELLKRILIPPPRITGFSEDTWAEVVNPIHLERLSKFLAIIKLDGDIFRDVLIQTICNLYISGVFIPDDRIFQRDISGYLDSDAIRYNFLLSYMLLKKFPVYYNEVGATGKIRDDTTEIDSWGNDPVLYFLRKQVHANASNYNIHLVEAIIRSWVYDDPFSLKEAIPEEVFNKLNRELLEQYSSAMRPLFESFDVVDSEGLHLNKLVSLSEDTIRERIENVRASEEIKSKVFLVCRIYREITKKYSLTGGESERKDIFSILPGYVKKLNELKQIMVSAEKTQARESLYFKRHIAFGIPSVMGSYHEPKFDALAETLRIEERLRVLFEEVIAELDKRRDEFSISDVRWLYCLEAMNELLKIYDLCNFRMNELMVIVKENRLRVSQIVDMFRMWQRELSWIVEFINKIFHKPLVDILRVFSPEELPGHIKKLKTEDSNFIDKAADLIIRDMVNSIVGLVELDRLLDTLIRVFTSHIESTMDAEFSLKKIEEVQQTYFPLCGLSDEEAMKLAPLIGNKAKNLIYVHNKGLLIPYGVVLPSIHTRDYQEYTESESFNVTVREAVTEIEGKTKTIFGGRKKPLFLSVRSGSFLSMPGILSSMLYCGMNRETLEAFIEETGSPWLAWDSYRIFIEHYGTIVYGIGIEVFDEILNGFMNRHGIARKEDFEPQQMEEVVKLYLYELNLKIPEDVYEQLRESVKAIYRSWSNERALQFRRSMRISEHWGTSVTLLQMIYGNVNGSGASVFFTRKPFSLEKGIYGETKEQATGAELVYGRFVNRPLTRQQALHDQKSLEEMDPELFLMHKDLAERIEKAMRGLPQEVEVTYTKQPDGQRIIYVLQTRRMEFHRGFTKRFDDICRMESNLVGRGIGVYGGALSGVAIFSSTPEHIKKLRRDFNLPVILLRKEASTDDVSLMPEIDGIVTAAGGATSHAAILAQKFSVTGVVSCSDMKIEVNENGETYARIGGFIIKEGTHISIDGSTGLVYSGLCLFTVPAERY